MSRTTASQFVARVAGVLPWLPADDADGASGDTCWLCGGPIDGVAWCRHRAISETFTNPTLVRSRTSEAVCQGCIATFSAEAWAIYARSSGHELKTGNRNSWRQYSHLFWANGSAHPTKATWKGFLIDPPEPPFVAVITEQGQKQLIHRASIAMSRDWFPVQIEDNRVWVLRPRLIGMLAVFEQLQGLGFSRDEIATGRYQQGRLMRAGLAAWKPLEEAMADYRNVDPDLVRVVALVARRPEGDTE